MRSRRPRGAAAVALIVGMIGLLITVSLSWTSWTLNRHNERRLLVVQTRQAAALLSATILSISAPLETALQTADVTAGNPADFEKYMAGFTGSSGQFVSASLWEVQGSSVRHIASVGVAPILAAGSSQAQSFIDRALHSSTYAVTSIRAGSSERIGYAVASPTQPRYVIYAERAIPANREVPVEANSAFSELNYATYVGADATAATLATTDVLPARLPLPGDTVREKIPFGDSYLTLVTTARGHLGGALGFDLPWILLGAGIVLSAGTAGAAGQLVGRRRRAERDAGTITGLYGKLDALYGEQRTIAQTLQLALLPRSDPSIPNVEIATRYVAGAEGVDIGGDWYSIDLVDDHRLAFVVGDVSGRGVEAAAIMARLRFTIRAYLMEGHPPQVALDMCSAQLDINADGHMATVLAGVADLRTGQLLVANAGHPNPLIIRDGGAEYLSTEAGPPLGIGWDDYEVSSLELAPGSTLCAFTDGLIERREEGIDVGLMRLARAAVASDAGVESPDLDRLGLDDLLGRLVSELAHAGPEDDIAILAFRIRPTA